MHCRKRVNTTGSILPIMLEKDKIQRQDILIIPNGHNYSATAIGRFYAACIHGVTLPYAAAVIKIVLEAGGWQLFSRNEPGNFKQDQYKFMVKINRRSLK